MAQVKVPKYIRESMHRIADLQSKAAALSRTVDDWFVSHGFDLEELRGGDGFTLEELDYGNDVTDVLCDRIENEGFGKITDTATSPW